MPTRTKNQNTLVLGQWNVLCDVCGFKFKSGDIKERWGGLRVCADDYEQRHVADFFKVDGEDPSVPYSRPDDQGTESAAPDAYADTTIDIPEGTFSGEL